MTNDYKPDTGKPPVMDAVFIPYRRTLLAIAAMKADMAEKHKLQGASNPFEEWRQLPNAKRRLSNAGARHALNPWEVNHADGKHLHIIHAICGLMMAAELHLEEQDALLERLLAEEGAKEFKAARRRADTVGQFWTGDSGTWHCLCGCGRPEACTCDRSHGDHS